MFLGRSLLRLPDVSLMSVLTFFVAILFGGGENDEGTAELLVGMIILSILSGGEHRGLDSSIGADCDSNSVRDSSVLFSADDEYSKGSGLEYRIFRRSIDGVVFL